MPEQVGQRDALDLCRLLATPPANSACGKAETTLDDLQLAATALAVLARDPDSNAAWGALTGLVRAR
jgi:hypothetical protein